MKQTFTFTLALAASCLLLANCAPRDRSIAFSPSVPPHTARSEELLMQLAGDYPGISATIFHGDKVVWSFAHGFIDSEQREPVTENTRFNIYSTSKALTGLAFAQQVESGRLSLTSTVRDIAPDLPTSFHDIRVQDLLSHTSGIRHYYSPGDWLKFAQKLCDTPLEAIEHFADDPLEAPPGSIEHYSTFAFVLASEVLLRATGESNFALALNNALGPWANFQLDRIEAEKSQLFILAGALPRLPEGTEPDDIIPMPPLSAECKFGGGGVIASSKELARAGAALYLGEIIPNEHLTEALQPWSEVSRVVYGAGLVEQKLPSASVLTWGLSGGAPGGRSYLLVAADPQLAVAITGNFDGPNMERTARQLVEIWQDAL